MSEDQIIELKKLLAGTKAERMVALQEIKSIEHDAFALLPSIIAALANCEKNEVRDLKFAAEMLLSHSLLRINAQSQADTSAVTSIVGEFEELLSSSNDEVRVTAASALGSMGLSIIKIPRGIKIKLINLMDQDPSNNVRRAARHATQMISA